MSWETPMRCQNAFSISNEQMQANPVESLQISTGQRKRDATRCSLTDVSIPKYGDPFRR